MRAAVLTLKTLKMSGHLEGAGLLVFVCLRACTYVVHNVINHYFAPTRHDALAQVAHSTQAHMTLYLKYACTIYIHVYVIYLARVV